MKINDINPLDFAAFLNSRIKDLEKQATVNGEVKLEHTDARARLNEIKTVAYWVARAIFPEDNAPGKRDAFLRMAGVQR